jgi:hypothetical protein
MVGPTSPALQRIQLPSRRPLPPGPQFHLPSPKSKARAHRFPFSPNGCNKHLKLQHFDPTTLTRYTP